MDRDDWITALRNSCEDLFLNEENILALFTSTGHKFESILSRDVNSVTNIPEIYDTTRDILFTIKKLFEILPGSTALNEYEIEGETLRFNSFRLGFQRRLNILTPLEFNQNYLLKFIGTTISHFPNTVIGAIGDKDTSFLHWSSTVDEEDITAIPTFFFRSALADGNSLFERSQMDMNIPTIKEVSVQTANHTFLLTLSDGSEDILLVEDKQENKEWLTRLSNLFTRYAKDRAYFLPDVEKFDQEIILHMSLVILRRFLSYLLPPKRKGSIPFTKIAQSTNLPEDLLIWYFDANLDQDILKEFGLILKKEEVTSKESQSVKYTLIIDKLSNTRVLTYYLMEINRFFDSYVNLLPSKEKSASSSGFMQYQSTSSYLGTIWGSYVFGSILGESDTLFNLNSEIISDIKELVESRKVLFEFKDEIDKYSTDLEPEKMDQFNQQYDRLSAFLNEKILQLNEKIAKFTAAIIQSYLIMLKAIKPPVKVSTAKKGQQLHSVVEFTFTLNDKTVLLNDDPKDWITLVFFSHILSQGDVTDFKSSLGKELMTHYEIVSKAWDDIQLLTLESEDWTISEQVNLLFIKPSRRRDMLLKFLALKEE